MDPKSKLFVLAFVALFACTNPASAQNPLRLPGSGTFQPQHPEIKVSQNGIQQDVQNLDVPLIRVRQPLQPPTQELSPEIYKALYGTEAPTQSPTVSRPTNTNPSSDIHVDPNFQPTDYQEAVPNNLAPVIGLLENLQTRPADQRPAIDDLPAENFGQPLNEQTSDEEPKKSEPLTAVTEGKDKLHEVAEKILYNTLIVLSIGIGFIFVAKQIYKPKTSSKNKTDKQAFQVVSNMKLAPKVSLFLVNVDDTKLVVATDPTGVKSVVRLTESFSETFGELKSETEEGDSSSKQESDSNGTYTLSSLGKSAGRDRDGENEAAIRAKMEGALAEHGLKDFFLNALRAGKQ